MAAGFVIVNAAIVTEQKLCLFVNELAQEMPGK
jgi:hypothetical protein